MAELSMSVPTSIFWVQCFMGNKCFHLHSYGRNCIFLWYFRISISIPIAALLLSAVFSDCGFDVSGRCVLLRGSFAFETMTEILDATSTGEKSAAGMGDSGQRCA